MIRFIFKGLLRDRQRSLLPVIVVVTGVFLTVFLHCWMNGILGDLIDFNAKFSTGHVKVMTKAYAERVEQTPNDLALVQTGKLTETLQKEFPEMAWIQRIRFGGLIDAPDAQGETRSQGPAIGWGIDLLSANSTETQRLNIPKSMVKGHIPTQAGEVLISEQFAEKLKVVPGDQITLLGSTMFGSMTVYNFKVAGTVKFGSAILDRGAIIADIHDVQLALDMPDAASEILGYFKTNFYNKELAAAEVTRFMTSSDPADPYSPVMVSLRDQNGLSSMVDYMDLVSAIVISIFVMAMSLVLWNAGLLGGLRRYGEVGVRLAMGESKGHVYRSLISESILIGLVGSLIGSAIGLSLSFWIQKHGIDVSGFMKNASMMLPAVFRTEVTLPAFYVGFVPGLFATVIGTSLAGIGIYKRKTAQLFKELE
ncbi:MAG: FtsX-like permease family protein [Porphyromonadaceae bacterium]|nr:MAG: FtsX-like permease family protein [Porphyromonadaceae bacterium]